MPKIIHELPFVKMHGAGNDYIYIDDITTPFPEFLKEDILPVISRKISDRHYGIGSDGLIVIQQSEIADFRMRIFNADGSEAQMCGNGIRCVAKYVYERKLSQKTSLMIETLGGIKKVDLFVKEGRIYSIRVDMGQPIFAPDGIPIAVEISGKYVKTDIQIKDKIFNVTAIGMGNPHSVVFVDELGDELINTYGPLIESHSLFPEKTNVEFVKVINRNQIEMRVWERGSKETMACGTGACASAVASWLNGYTERNVEVKLLGGNLKIAIDKESQHIFMTGDADFIAQGVYFYEVDK